MSATIENDVRTTNQRKKERCLLKHGDIIQLEPGMEVYTYIPSMFLLYGAFFDTKPSHTKVTIGEIFKNVPESVQFLTDEIFKKIHPILPVTKDQITNFINTLNFDDEIEELDTSIYAGEYKVIEAFFDGGSKCFDLPDGWHVFCQKVNDPLVQVDFYQTGCFTAMIEDIQPINR